MKEFELVALTRDLESSHLKKGDVGVIVDVLADGHGYVVEFILQTGFTAALEEIDAKSVRPLKEGELQLERYREWKPEWTGPSGYCPTITDIPECSIPPGERPAKMHYLGYIDSSEG